MHAEQWTVLFRILFSALVLLALLWLALSGWPIAARANAASSQLGDLPATADKVVPLLWKYGAQRPGIWTSLTT